MFLFKKKELLIIEITYKCNLAMTKNPTLGLIESNIKIGICNELNRLGIHYRLHSRVKERDSLDNKITSKGKGYYTEGGKKVQDLIGFRIVTYFIDDVNLLWDYFYDRYEVVDDMYDEVATDIFKPLRKNMVCRMSATDVKSFNEMREIEPIYKLIDTTFEIQFRTTLSEGWHEVDHSLRYKCKEDWEGYPEEDRMLNGVFAALETSDRSLKALFDDMAYNHYKSRNWTGMLRMKFRLQFDKKEFSLQKIMNTNRRLAKQVFRFDRLELIHEVAKSGLHLPISLNNIVYLVIYIENSDEELKALIPEMLKEEFSALGIMQKQ